MRDYILSKDGNLRTWLCNYPTPFKVLGTWSRFSRNVLPFSILEASEELLYASAMLMHMGIIAFQVFAPFRLTMIALNVFMLLSFKEEDLLRSGGIKMNVTSAEP